MLNKKIRILLISLIVSGCQIFSNGRNDVGNSLELYRIIPLAPQKITEGTIIQANFKYSINDYEKGKYFIMAQFETCTTGLTYDGDMPESEYAYPESKNGEIEFKFPMKYVWNQGIISKPYVVRFYLNKRVDEDSSEVIATTGPVMYVTDSEN